MSEKVQLKGCICEVNFGYNARMEEYTNLSSDIPEISKITPTLYKLAPGPPAVGRYNKEKENEK